MPSIRFALTVEMEDEITYSVDVDQRDIAAFEREPFGRPFRQVEEVIFTFLRWTAWHALRYRYRTIGDMSWQTFDAKCIEVTDQTEEGEAPDPTSPAASAGT